MRIQMLASFLLAAIVASVLLTPAFAEPLGNIVQTGCDTLSMDPPLVEVEFFVENSTSTPLCRLGLYPDVDSCLALSCSPPDGWGCYLDAMPAEPFWMANKQENCIHPGERLGPLKMVIDPFSCCYQAIYGYYDPPGPSYSETVCFDCDKPVQALSATWGELKAIYR